jgi:nucleoid-associated protein YgaU
MTNDAKLGLVAGLGLVIALAIMFSRHDHPPEKPADEPVSMVGTPTSSAKPLAPAAAPSPATSPLRATATVHRGQNHTVKYGESLYSLARQYYGDGKKYTEIYRVNRRIVTNPDYVPPGTVLFIPDLETGK